MRNIKLIIEYKGTGYCGFQKQPKMKSVQGILEETISKILQEEIRITGAGRTDAGVHAKGQCVNIMLNSDIDCGRLRWSANSLLPPDIVIKQANEVPESFHARRDAKSREYKYLILNRDFPSPFWHECSLFFRRPLNVAAMAEAAVILEGEHDFASFCAAESRPDNAIRTMERVKIEKIDDLIHLDFEGNAFLHNMVRIIVGTLIQVGQGTTGPEQICSILEAKDRRKAGPTAPAHGLFLMKVNY